MFRVLKGTCCAVATVLLLAAIVWVPANAVEEDDPFGEHATTKNHRSGIQNAATYPAFRPSQEVAAARRINKILDTQLIAPLDFPDTPLCIVLDALQDDYDIPIVVDQAALDELGASADEEISVNLRHITLRAALELMLRQVPDLTYTPRDQVLLITTEEEAEAYLEIRVYQVGDLLDSSRFFNGVDGKEAYQQLITVITRSVDHNSWTKNKTGEGEIQPLQPGLLVISQTHRVHQRIARLLADIREAKRYTRLAQDHATSANRLITQGIKIEVDGGENPAAVYQKIYESIVGSVDWQVADSELNEHEVWLKVLPDGLLVRHHPNVVRQVKRIVSDMKLAISDDSP